MHAHLSSEAQHRYKRQRRFSTILSVVISFLSLTFLVLLLATLILDLPAKSQPWDPVVRGRSVHEEPPELKEIRFHQRPVARMSHTANRVIIANPMAQVAIPVVDIEPTEAEPFGLDDKWDGHMDHGIGIG